MRTLLAFCAIALPATAGALTLVEPPPPPDHMVTPRCLELLAALDRGDPVSSVVAGLEASGDVHWQDALCLEVWYAPAELVSAARSEGAAAPDDAPEPEPLPRLAWETGAPAPPVEAGVHVEATTHLDLQLLALQVPATDPATGGPWDTWPADSAREQRRWARQGKPPIEPPDLVAYARVGPDGDPSPLIASVSDPTPADGHALSFCAHPTFTGISLTDGVVRLLVVDRDPDEETRGRVIGPRVAEVRLGPADFAEALRADGPVVIDVRERTGGRVELVRVRAEGSTATRAGAWSRLATHSYGWPDWGAVQDPRTGRCL